MVIIRKAHERGRGQLDWLDSFHTFSFADYYDPNWMGFGHLRVINEDFIKPDRGFATHSHHNMEIVTYVISGILAHKDSMGNGSIIKPGEIQRMSAGTGVRHSEFNASLTEPLHLLQIWIVPQETGIQPGYEQKQIQKTMNQLILIGAPTAAEGIVKIHQQIKLYAGYFSANFELTHAVSNRPIWLQLIQGQIRCNQHVLAPGDGLLMQDEASLTIVCVEDCEFLLFEMDSLSSI